MTKVSLTKKVLFSLALSAGFALTSSPALAKCKVGDCWGAVAYGPNGAWFSDVNYNDEGEVRKLVLLRCGNKCSEVLTFHNDCGAFASGNGGFGWAKSRNKDKAVGEAMLSCQKVAKNCELRVYACTAEK